MAEFKRDMAAGARAGIPFAILIGLVNTAYGKPSGEFSPVTSGIETKHDNLDSH